LGAFFTRTRTLKANALKAFCKVLQLNWEEIVDRPHPQPNLDLDSIVQEIRQKFHTKTQQLDARMQLLDIAQPVDVSNLYIEVNILEEITS
jgi:hypothetical protein